MSRDPRRGAKYLRYLEREISLVAGMLEGRRRAAEVYLGGGTPTFLSAAELGRLMRRLGQHFELLPGKYAIEADPRTLDSEKIAALGGLGFGRMSLGVQDFDAEVQRAVNRVQTVEQTGRAVSLARQHGFTTINIDLVYGLPRQTLTGFNCTLDQVLGLKPERIALYRYVHSPGSFGSQRRIHAAAMPAAELRLDLMMQAVNKLLAAGYVHIGMDHFALPHDELVIAARRAGLHRNFDGYSTRPEGDLIAFGISAISRVGASYSQNVKPLGDYYACLDRSELPVLRGITLTVDDLLRRAVIQSLLCHFELSIESIEIAYLIKFRDYFADEWDKLELLARDELVTLEPEWITVSARGRLLVHVIATVFDRHLSRRTPRRRSSNAL